MCAFDPIRVGREVDRTIAMVRRRKDGITLADMKANGITDPLDIARRLVDELLCDYDGGRLRRMPRSQRFAIMNDREGHFGWCHVNNRIEAITRDSQLLEANNDENEFDRLCQKTLRVLQRFHELHGDKWMQGSELRRRVRGVTKQQWESIVESLCDQRRIEVQTHTRGGRPGKLFRAFFAQ